MNMHEQGAFAAVQPRTPAQIIAEWQDAVGVLARAKQRESELRSEVLQGAFQFKGANDSRKGTENFELQGGSKLKAVFKLNFKLEAGDALDKALANIEKTAEGKFIAARLVKFKPELSVTEYNQLDDGSKVKAQIDAVLTISAGTPSLELVEPKAKK